MNTNHGQRVRPSVFVDGRHVPQTPGGAIDWNYVSAAFALGAAMAKLSAVALKGATALSVDALTKRLEAGTLLYFGNRANVVVTVADADVNAAETAFTVAALSGPIPTGEVLEFSGSGAGFAKTSARLATGATSFACAALAEDIDNAATATYLGGPMLARVTVAAEVGATSVTVQALKLEIDDNAEAFYAGEQGGKILPQYTIMAQLASGLYIPRAGVLAAETAKCILLEEANEASVHSSKTGYGMAEQGLVYENLMPEADTSGNIDSTFKTELLAVGFRFRDFLDNR